MRVYVETNFLLEWVFEQGELEHVESLLGLAETHAIELVLPAPCLLEAYVTIRGRDGRRRDLIRQLERELDDLGRTLSLATEVSTLKGMLTGNAVSMLTRYETVRGRLLAAAGLASLDHGVAGDAANNAFSLSVPDALVLACVMRDLATRPAAGALFVTRNSKDFDTPDVRSALDALRCETLFRFAAARARIAGNAQR